MVAVPARRFNPVRRYVWFGFGLLVAGCGTARVTATPVRETTGVAASCAAVSPAEKFNMARKVFVGVMLPGPTTQQGVLGSPARMRVERYLKGHGPRIVRVDTALRIEPGGVTGNSEGIEPKAGERWKIYTQSRRQPFDTSICSGSTRVAVSDAADERWGRDPGHVRTSNADVVTRYRATISIVDSLGGLLCDRQTWIPLLESGHERCVCVRRSRIGSPIQPIRATAGCRFPPGSSAATWDAWSIRPTRTVPGAPTDAARGRTVTAAVRPPSLDIP